MVLIAVLVALSLPLASTASADEISGTGTIWAKGAGLAILRGDGEIEIEGHGVGVVWIKGAETLEASGKGHRWEVPSGNATLFWGWSGTIQASGQKITVWMTGGLIEFTASGTGRVYLRGHGRYEINGHDGFWSPTGEVIRLDAVPVTQ
ncbi:MAG: hypothetical protein CEE40_03260 [Chloroflexi bacterium B3_Chlor]|nr:MAG: hypothetical protein CEE40_03260 [Chloroflexi bacterium B3_Chlor]